MDDRVREAGRGRQGAATHARIEAEALRLFAEKGFDGTSIRDIAQAVGVADAALYRHFASKEALGRDLFLSRFGALAQAVSAIGGGALAFPGKVRALVDVLCRLFDEERDTFTFILFHQHAHLRFVPASREGNPVEALRDIMAGARAAGEIEAGDADLATAQALGCVLQPALFVLYGRLRAPLASHAPALASAVCQAVGARQAA